MAKARIFYARTDEFWRKGEKYKYLEEAGHRGNIAWQELEPDKKHNWLTEGMRDEFESFVPVGSKEGKASKGDAAESILKIFSNGNDSGRDDWVYNFDSDQLLKNVKVFADTYNGEVDRWIRAGKPDDVDEFVINDERRIKWTRNAKRDLRLGRYVKVTPSRVRHALYHPFTLQFLYTGKIFNKEVALFPRILPTAETETENRIICVAGKGNRKLFGCMMINHIPPLDLAFEKSQCFPFYTYDEDGSNRRENITDWALEKFRVQYRDESISKWDIFHYVYAVLHHPVYRERYAANLKRELPRIPFVGNVGAGLVPARTGAAGSQQPEESALDKKGTSAPQARRAGTSPAPTEIFRAFVGAGARLAEIHVDYEAQTEYPLERIENPEAALDWRVEKMRLSKDKGRVVYNDFLTLAGVPSEAFEYRLGNRSALEWVIDQYQVTTDKRSGITNDPNRADDPQYILRLVGQVITVSLETVKIVQNLPGLLSPMEA